MNKKKKKIDGPGHSIQFDFQSILKHTQMCVFYWIFFSIQSAKKKKSKNQNSPSCYYYILLFVNESFHKLMNTNSNKRIPVK